MDKLRVLSTWLELLEAWLALTSVTKVLLFFFVRYVLVHTSANKTAFPQAQLLNKWNRPLSRPMKVFLQINHPPADLQAKFVRLPFQLHVPCTPGTWDTVELLPHPGEDRTAEYQISCRVEYLCRITWIEALDLKFNSFDVAKLKTI